jgi:splicing factor 3B subunit 2
VDVSVDVDALERDDKLSRDQIAQQYESSKQQEAASNPWTRSHDDDLSQMIADESSKRLKKDQERRGKR